MKSLPAAQSRIDSDSIGCLFDAHASALALYARQLCDDPNDVVQEAFMKLAEQRHMPGHPPAWLYKVVRNGALMKRRSRRRRQVRESHVANARADWFQHSTMDALETAEVTEVLSQLPEDQREIVTAHIWGGLGFREISELLGISASSVHRRYQKSLQEIRDRMGITCNQQT